MRWLLTIAGIVIIAAMLYVGLIVAANRGIDLALLNRLPGLERPPTGLTNCERSARFQSALHEYESAAKQMGASNYRDANLSFDRGLADLGSSYEPHWFVLDDTGLYLGNARLEESRGHLKSAVLEKCRMLESRLEMCGEIKQGNKIYHLGPLPSRC